MSFMSFRDKLVTLARRHPCTLVLPEALDARVLAAAARASHNNVADCLLLGDKTEIAAVAAANNITLPPPIKIMQPAIEDYVPALQRRRLARGKVMDEAQARTVLANPVAMAAMLVAENHASAMVAGAITASADVLRPVLQILGLRADASLASSAFLMCFDDGMKVFADCALNIAPDAQQLAAIAVQSAATASAFGLSPVIAMLSYVSGGGGNEAVARVAAASRMVKQQLPDIAVAGPIQYDAAISPAVASIKLPDTPAAGNANVLIFPDIQAGNITYKAVQQSANIVSIGPLIQGLAAPANDLSRGATADDIYYTIAATVVQAAIYPPT